MRNYIIISKEQADKIRGRHGKYSACEPVQFPDGNFAIPERLLDDKEFDDIKDTLKQYQKECTVQDIEDLDEEKGKAIEEGKYYLSKEYWVIKSLKNENIKLPKGTKLTDMTDKFQVKADIGAFVDAEKLAANKLSFSKGLSLFNYTKPVTNLKGEQVSRWQLFKDMWKELCRRVKDKIVTFVGDILNRIKAFFKND